MKIPHAESPRQSRVLPAALAFLLVLLGFGVWYFVESRGLVRDEFSRTEIVAKAQPLIGEIRKLHSRLEIDAWIDRREDEVEKTFAGGGTRIKKNQRKSVEWAGAGLKTPLAIVYIHGFSASRLELDPVISKTAAALGANVFFTRLKAHGLSTGEEFATVRARDWAVDVEEAIAIGQQIGDRVVVVAMSTGAPLVLENVGRNSNRWMGMTPATASSVKSAAGRVSALVLLSPNYEVLARGSSLLEGPFASTMARWVIGDHREFATSNSMHAERWTARYRVEGIVAMQRAVSSVRTVDFARIDVPVLTVFSSHDDVVDTSRAIEIGKSFGNGKSKTVSLPEARRHELVSATFDSENIPALVELLSGWIKTAVQ